MKNNLIKIISILTLIFLTHSTNVLGQVLKFNATLISVARLVGSEFKETASNEKHNELFVLDYTNKIITVTSNNKSSITTLKIVDQNKITNKDGVPQLTFECLNGKDTCKVVWIVPGKIMLWYMLTGETVLLYEIIVAN